MGSNALARELGFSGVQIETDGSDANAVSISNAFRTAFQVTSQAGFLCEEPLWGVAFDIGVVRRLEGSESHTGESELDNSVISAQVYGQVQCAVHSVDICLCERVASFSINSYLSSRLEYIFLSLRRCQPPRSCSKPRFRMHSLDWWRHSTCAI